MSLLALAGLGAQLRHVHKIRPVAAVRHMSQVQRGITPTEAADPGQTGQS
jgi:hypothetical protein